MTLVLYRKAGLAVLLTLATVAAVATPSLAAGTAAQRQACTDDAFKFCRQYIPDVPRVTACMKKNKSKLSRACRAQFK